MTDNNGGFWITVFFIKLIAITILVRHYFGNNTNTDDDKKNEKIELFRVDDEFR